MARDSKLTVRHVPSHLPTHYLLETEKVEFQRFTPPKYFSNTVFLATVYLEHFCVLDVNTFPRSCPISAYSQPLAFYPFSVCLEEYSVNADESMLQNNSLLIFRLS